MKDLNESKSWSKEDWKALAIVCLIGLAVSIALHFYTWEIALAK